MIKNKKGLSIKAGMFALIAMSMMVLAVGYWIDDWNTKYDSGLTYDLEDYSKLDDLSSYASSSKGNISVKSSFDEGNFEGTSLRGAFGVINNIFTPFQLVFGDGGLLDSIEDRWGIPNYITIGFATMMVLAIIFALIKLFFRQTTEV